MYVYFQSTVKKLSGMYRLQCKDVVNNYAHFSNIIIKINTVLGFFLNIFQRKMVDDNRSFG